MKDIKFRFEQMKAKYPGNGDYINFRRAVENQEFSEKAISLAFGKLVDKNEYERKDRIKLIDQLARASKPLYGGDLKAKFRPGLAQSYLFESSIITSLK